MSVSLRFLADEDFDNDILRGMLRRLPNLDIVRAQDVGLSGALGSESVGMGSAGRAHSAHA
jgi:hypothetical protein